MHFFLLTNTKAFLVLNGAIVRIPFCHAVC
jgi:hypothetical protein